MKSEKAKEILSASSITDSCGYEYLLMSCAEKAVELAEQEAEERMRNRAIKAYCSECTCYETGVCALDPDKCVSKLLFVQNMNEE